MGSIRRSARLSAPNSTSDTHLTQSTSVASLDVPPKRSTRNGNPLSTPEPTFGSPLQDSDSFGNPNYSESKESSRKRKKPSVNKVPFNGDVMEHILQPITIEDRANWKGWCEIESEPAFFNVMLREFGVEGVKVQEVVSLDEEFLAFIPKPIYGLIFLFEFKDDDPSKQEATCPDHIWFANQTTSNACASIALLNIVMNIPDIKLGPTLESLKDFTSTMNPVMCGYSVCNHEYIRQVHNSFTRKMDMLNADLALSNEANVKKSRQKAGAKNKSEQGHEQAGFHFVAFLPIRGSVWKLDGLERQPMNLGDFKEDWMNLARPMIEARMQRYESDQIQFNLLSLCKSPLLTIPMELATNVQTLKMIESRLSNLQSDWQHFAAGSDLDGLLRGPNATYKVSQDLLDEAQVSKSIIEKVASPDNIAESLFCLRQELISAQRPLRAAIVDEVEVIDQDNERALSRRNDYTPMIHLWVNFLAKNGTLQRLVETAGRG